MLEQAAFGKRGRDGIAGDDEVIDQFHIHQGQGTAQGCRQRLVGAGGFGAPNRVNKARPSGAS